MKTNPRSKLLAINFGGIGDEILFLPTLKSIRKALPDHHVSLLLEPRSRSVEQVTNLVDEILTFDIKKRPLYVSDLVQLVRLIRDGGFDIVISSGSSKMVAALLFLSGIETRIGYDSGGLTRKLLTAPVPLNRDQYAAMMYHDLTKGLGVQSLPAAECIPDLTIPSSSLGRMQELVHGTATARSATKRVVIHPGTSKLAVEKGIIKTWKIESWVQLIKLLIAEKGTEVLVAGGPDDEAIIKAIVEQAPKSPAVRNCYGKTRSLGDLAALIELCDVLVCVDSAPMHIGVGLRKPLVALFGPTDERKLLPQDTRFVALRGKDSAPSLTGAQLQPLAERGVQLQPDIVFRSVLDQLKAATAQGSHREPAQ